MSANDSVEFPKSKVQGR